MSSRSVAACLASQRRNAAAVAKNVAAGRAGVTYLARARELVVRATTFLASVLNRTPLAWTTVMVT